MAQILATDMSISVYDSTVVCKVFIIPSSETGVVCKIDDNFGSLFLLDIPKHTLHQTGCQRCTEAPIGACHAFNCFLPKVC